MRLYRKIKLLSGNRDVMVLDASSVKVIADMQKDLDAYHFVFGNLSGFLTGQFGKSFKPAILKGIAASEDVNTEIVQICEAAFELREKYERLKERCDGEEEC